MTGGEVRHVFGATPAGTAPTPEPSPRPRAWPRRTLVAVLAVLGLAGVGGGGCWLALTMTRPATAAEVSAAGRAEIASRWQRLTAGQIFPSRVSYLTSAGIRATARRTGIAAPSSCRAALDPAVARRLRAQGCRTVLRATYTDASGTLVATLGVAVLPSAHAGVRLQTASTSPRGWTRAGVRAVAFPGTVTSLFKDSGRQVFGAQIRGPYVFLVTAGYADGRPGNGPARAASPLNDLVAGLAGPTEKALTSGRSPCARKDIRC